MAKEKVTITLDRAKAEEARALLGEPRPISQVIDLALDQLIRARRIRSDAAAYRSLPSSDEEVGIAAAADPGGLEDDTDWDALYTEEE